jgi:hypothetical protein
LSKGAAGQKELGLPQIKEINATMVSIIALPEKESEKQKHALTLAGSPEGVSHPGAVEI